MNQRKKGIVLSYVYMFVSILVTFLYTPFLIAKLGKSEYGLYTLASSIIAYLSLLDLGLGNSMIRYVSKYKTLKKEKEEAQINGMFLLLYLFIGLLSIIIGYIIIVNSNLFFSKGLTTHELETAKILLIILTLNISINFPLSIFGSYVIASERFFFQKLLLIIKTILAPLIMLPLLYSGFKSIALVIVLSILTLSINVSNFILSKFKLKMRIEISRKCFSYLKEIFSYSFFIFLAMIVDSIFNNTDQVLLGMYCGTTAISIYAISSQIRLLYEQLSVSISGVFLPKVVRMVESGKTKKEISELFLKISRIQMLVLFLVLSGFVVFGRPFITIWTDKSFLDAYFIALIIIVPASIPLTQNIAISVIQAENKHKFRSILYLVIAVLNVILSIYLVKLYSGIGAAIGTSIALFLGHILIMNIYYYRVIKLDIPGYWKNFIKLFIPVAILASIAYCGVSFISIDRWLKLFACIAVYTIFYMIIVYILFMNSEEKDYIRKIFRKIKKINYYIYPKFLVKNIIIFESSPDYGDSTYEIYKKMLDNKVNEKYKFVWFVSNKDKFKDIKIKNVEFVNYLNDDKHDKALVNYYTKKAKIIIDSNNFVQKRNRHQVRYYLFHGMGYKNIPAYSNACGNVDYFITTSDIFHPTYEREYKKPINKFINIGMARNDILVTKTNKDIHKIFNIDKKSKIVLWLPTYRNHKNKNSSYHFDNVENGLMIINNKDEIKKLNDVLVKNNVYILFKPHPAEDISYLKDAKASNILLIDNDYLKSKDIDLYELLSRVDSLITDYSSVYFDFLLTDNIIGLTFNDIKEYEKNFGFTCDDYESTVYGEKIYKFDDFKKYIENVSKGNYDKKEYLKYKKLYHTYYDGKATDRLYDFIKKEL